MSPEIGVHVADEAVWGVCGYRLVSDTVSCIALSALTDSESARYM